MSVEPKTVAELLVLALCVVVLAAVYMVVGFDHNASALLFFSAWTVMFGSFLTYCALRFEALRGRRAMPLGKADKVVWASAQVAGLVTFALMFAG